MPDGGSTALPVVPDAALADVLRSGRPLLDLRAPLEFARGAAPDAVNMPLLDDDQRQRVGQCYKEHGQAKAVALGHRLVAGSLRAERMAAWQAWAEHHPGGALYCWRGGLRSQTVQQWLAEAGCTMPRLAGGWKALRQCQIDTLGNLPGQLPLRVLGGRTGTGKTDVLLATRWHLDLEGLAAHRGSAFGALPGGQPTVINWEANLARGLLQHQAEQPPWLLLEDEGRAIGRLSVPPALHAAMQQAPLVLLEATMADRVSRILRDYVAQPLVAGEPAADLQARLQAALDRIRRRLGGQRHSAVSAALADAFGNNAATSDGTWVEHLLRWYYDPMYDHQLADKLPRAVFRGDADAVLAWSAA